MIRSWLLALALLVASAGAAHARSERVIAYPRDQAWSAALRFLVVDEHVKVTEKDADAGYVVFEWRDDGKPWRGSLEVAESTSTATSRFASSCSSPIGQAALEEQMLDRLERKLRVELGPPEPAPSPPPKKDEPKDPPKAEPAPAEPPKDNDRPDIADAVTALGSRHVRGHPSIDLRSDTVTRPTPAMREAMFGAELGDDVFGDDPTVNALQARVAELLGKEAALWVPSGTMANQVALRAQTHHGDEIIMGVGTHCWRFESGGLAALAGVQTQVVGTDGMFTSADVQAAFKAADPYQAATRLVACENTHGSSGGAVWDPAALAAVVDEAHALGMRAHLDGARIWNAAIASKTSERALAIGFDSVSVCLSKGLGAPAGSMIAGSRALIKDCHRLRKMYGGGMRQVGILAAAGLYALDHHRARLADDHAHARLFADALADVPSLRVRPPQTNIVMIDLVRGTTADVIARAREAHVLIGANRVDARSHPGEAHLAQQLRVVFHLDVDRAATERASKVVRDIATALV